MGLRVWVIVAPENWSGEAITWRAIKKKGETPGWKEGRAKEGREKRSATKLRRGSKSLTGSSVFFPLEHATAGSEVVQEGRFGIVVNDALLAAAR